MSKAQEELALCEKAQRKDRAIQRDNAVFQTATDARRRIIIAKDVIKWLNTGRLVASHVYMGLSRRSARQLRMYSDPGIEADSSLRDEKTVNGFTCVACGIGSLLACAVERGAVDKLGLMELRGAKSIWEKLAKLWNIDQLARIEAAYEGGSSYVSGGTPSEPRSKLDFEVWEQCCLWRCTIVNDEERMRAIMANIIANGGDFKPEMLP